MSPIVKTQFAPQKKKSVRAKFCSRCGSLVNSTTKVCTGCGKKYFCGFRFNKAGFAISIMALLIVAMSVLFVFQYANTLEIKNTNETTISRLKSEISSLKRKRADGQLTIELLEGEIDTLESKQKDYLAEVVFFNAHAALVEVGSSVYHQYGCADFGGSSFWIYNIEAAEEHGYYPCSKCH